MNTSRNMAWQILTISFVVSLAANILALFNYPDPSGMKFGVLGIIVALFIVKLGFDQIYNNYPKTYTAHYSITIVLAVGWSITTIFFMFFN